MIVEHVKFNRYAVYAVKTKMSNVNGIFYSFIRPKYFVMKFISIHHSHMYILKNSCFEVAKKKKKTKKKSHEKG